MGKNIFGRAVNCNLYYTVLSRELDLQIMPNSVYPSANAMAFETVEEKVILLSF
jgi:hypothetical protein